MRIPEELSLTQDFDRQYQRNQISVLRTVERNACGCDYGGTSWATRDEADRVGDLLDLRPGRRLLEVGAGSGWPALYLAGKTGCDLALVDLPFEGLRIAAQRAVSDGLAGRCWIASANGAALPFGGQQFDAISHSDVLCCLDAKLEVLHDTRRVIRQGGAMVFTVISITPGRSSTEQARAIEFGPPFVDSACDYATMLNRCGWHTSDRVDVTAQWVRTTRRYLGEQEAHHKSLEVILGKDEFDSSLARMRAKIAAIDDGLLRRELYVAGAGGKYSSSPLI